MQQPDPRIPLPEATDELEHIADGLWTVSIFAGNPPSLMDGEGKGVWLRLAFLQKQQEDRVAELLRVLAPFAIAAHRCGPGHPPSEFLAFPHYHAAMQAIPIAGDSRTEEEQLAGLKASLDEAASVARPKLEGAARERELAMIGKAIEMRAMSDFNTSNPTAQLIIRRIATWHLETLEAQGAG